MYNVPSFLVDIFHEKGQSCARFGIHECERTSRFDTMFSKLSKVSLKFAWASLKVLDHKYLKAGTAANQGDIQRSFGTSPYLR